MATFFTKFFCAGALLAAGPSLLPAATGIDSAQPTNPGLQGNIKNDGWYNLTRETYTRTVDGTSHTIPGNIGYPQFPFSPGNAWPSPIYSQVNNSPSQRASLNKITNDNGTGYVAGYQPNGVPNGLAAFNADGTVKAGYTWSGTSNGYYPATEGLYSVPTDTGMGGSLGIFEASPLSGLQTLVFQIEMAGVFAEQSETGMPIGSFQPSSAFPQLTLTLSDHSTVTLVADWGALLKQASNGTQPVPSGPDGEDEDVEVFIDLYGFQWDVSEYQNNIESFVLTMTLSEHTNIYAMRLDQSDVMTQVIPEPSSWALFLGTASLLGLALRRKTLC